MSQNIKIQENENAYSFGRVKYLSVASGENEYSLWVPENERKLKTKSIDKNGIYRASDDGAYGWSSVFVNVSSPDSVTGKDDDGDDVVVKPDPETGVLEEEKVPSSIEITTQPTKLVYADGETIDFTGAVVEAYLETGGEYGTVPNEEITLNPTSAIYDPTADTGHAEYEGDSYVYRSGGMVTIKAYPQDGNELIEDYVATSGAGPFYAFGTAYTTPGESPNMGRGGFICSPNIFTANSIGHSATVMNYTYDGKAVYYAGRNAYQAALNPIVDAPVNAIDTNFNLVAWIAWVICYGTCTEGGDQTITVSWPRPGDGAILETSFDITVQQSFGGASGGGGQAGETGAGRND